MKRGACLQLKMAPWGISIFKGRVGGKEFTTETKSREEKAKLGITEA